MYTNNGIVLFNKTLMVRINEICPSLLSNTASTPNFDLTTGITLSVARIFSANFRDYNSAKKKGKVSVWRSYSGPAAQILFYQEAASQLFGIQLYSTSVRRVRIVSSL